MAGLDSLIPFPEGGLAFAGEYLTGILLPVGMGMELSPTPAMGIPTTAERMLHSMDTHIDIRRTEISNAEDYADMVGLVGIFGGTNMKKHQGGDKMWPWFRYSPWGWPGYGMLYAYPYGGYGYPGAAMPKEEEVRMLEDQEKWLTSELDGVRKRLEELRK